MAKLDGTYVPREKRPDAEPVSKKRKITTTEGDNVTSKQAKLMVNNVPHNILFAQALPLFCDKEMLAGLFGQYPGFVEVRTVPSKKDIAFIEFQDHIQAGIALQRLHAFKLTPPENTEEDCTTLQLTYAKQ